MSAPQEHAEDPVLVSQEDDVELHDEDIVEVVEDDGPGNEPMDDDDDLAGYDGEIIIGGPGPDDEDMMDEETQIEVEDNSWGGGATHQPGQSVFAVALHPAFPNPPLGVSGGEDDMAYIFSPVPPTSGGEINSESFAPVALAGHSDSVVSVEWSHDGDMVATGGMDGKVRVYKKGSDDFTQWPLVAEMDAGSEVMWVHWHPRGPVLAAGCEDSSVWLWQMPSGAVMTVLSGHTMSVTAGVFPPPAGRQILTASLDSTLILWNPSTSSPIFKTSVFCPPNWPEMEPAEHGITALAVNPAGTLAAVGSAAGAVKVVSLPKGDVVGTFTGHAEGESIEALQFVDVLGGAGGGKGVVLVSGATDGKGFVWDVATGKVRAELKHDEPITSLAAHPAPTVYLVTSASADRTLKTWDVRTGALIAEHKGHGGVVNGVAVAPAPGAEPSPNGLAAAQAVVSAGDEGVSLIWRI